MTQDKHLDQILDFINNTPPEEQQKKVWESKDWGLFYHFSDARRTLLEWLPMRIGLKVLEVGAECGALTGIFLDRELQVTALEIDPVKSQILQKRYEGKEDLTVVNGSFSALPEGEKYDLILACGVLPVAKSYLPEADDPYQEFLNRLKSMLAGNGRVVLALPNKLGMKYLSGAREDYTGAPFTGIEGYFYHPDVRTFGRKQLQAMLEQAGLKNNFWYYPYPDWRFPTAMYSDEKQPGRGELNRNLESADQERYVLFDECKAYDTILEEGLFQEFANSFLVISGAEKTSMPLYIKYAHERSRQYAIRTEQGWDEVIRKIALYPEGVEHVRGIFQSYELLRDRLKDTQIEVAPCRLVDNVIEMKFVKGRSLQQIMQDLAGRGKNDEINALISEYLMRLESFDKLHDIDLTFSNLIVPRDVSTIQDIKHAEWTLIDYEWTFEEARPKRYVLYRAFLLAAAEIGEGCEPLAMASLMKRINLTDDLIKKYRAREEEFQNSVVGDGFPYRDMGQRINPGIIPLAKLDEAYRKSSEPSKGKKRGIFGW